MIKYNMEFIAMKWYGKSKNTRGFTLIELIVVMAIISILTTIVTMSISSALKTTTNKSASTYLKTSWTVTATYLTEMSSGFTSQNVNASSLNLRFNDNRVSYLTTEAFPFSTLIPLLTGKVHIQYKINTGAGSKYIIARIVYRYKNTYYYTTNGGNTMSTRPV